MKTAKQAYAAAISGLDEPIGLGGDPEYLTHDQKERLEDVYDLALRDAEAHDSNATEDDFWSHYHQY